MTETFDDLQQKLLAQWPAIGNPTDEDKGMVVVPSLSIELPPEIAPLLPAYEERFLFLLLLLAQPRARVTYVTSQPVPKCVVDYYLDLIRTDRSDLWKRLTLISLGDPSPRPLTQKILDRPLTVERLRRTIADAERTHLVPFNTTELEERLAIELGIPMYGAASRVASLGTKSGGRRIFAEEGVPHPRGREVRGASDVLDALAELDGFGVTGDVMIKLNEGVGGLGNAVLDLGASRSDVAGHLRVEGGDGERFLRELDREGGIVEQRLSGTDFRSPSVQFRIAPGGDVELLSTHDQILGGPTGQAFFGSRFPADPDYAGLICDLATPIAQRLAHEGVIGRFAVDFVTFRDGEGEWRAYAIEINLRKGGTTHPFLTLQFLTNGSYDRVASVFSSDTGPKHYVATDHLESSALTRLTPDDAVDLAVRERLWDPEAQEGVIFHMLSALPAAGRVGLTAIGGSAAQADRLYERAVALLHAEAALTLLAMTDRVAQSPRDRAR